MRLYKWFKDHYILLCIYLTLLVTFKWNDLKAFHDFIKNPEDLKIEEVDFELYSDLDEDLWK